MISKLTLCALLLSAVSAVNLNEKYAQYIYGEQPITKEVAAEIYAEYLAEYPQSANVFQQGTKHDGERFSVFYNNLQAFAQHNSDPTKTFTRGINKYADWTYEEFVTYYHMKPLGEEQNCSATHKGEGVVFSKKFEDIPESYDWRDHDGVSPVKDQGNCGSCWTFSTVGCLEARALIDFKQFWNSSEQQLVDCAGAYDNYGCDGGLPSHAFQYISDAGGLALESTYPYHAVDGTCYFDDGLAVIKVIGGSVNITVNDEDELQQAVFEHGPVSVAYDCEDDFFSYTSGVYSSTICKDTASDVNHAVLAVGYGVTDDGLKYWIVKNSWGTDWGDNGYFKIERGVNMCGIAQCNSYPLEIEIHDPYTP